MTRLALLTSALLLFAGPAYGEDMAAKTARCAFCHGATGVSGNPIWPSLAGLDAAYLEARMQSYRAGENTSTNARQMRFVLNGFSDDEVKAIAAFYAAADPAPTAGAADAMGAQIYHEGWGDEVAPCSSCHGLQGEGIPDVNAPRLAGQSSHYMHAQLSAYAAGTRPDKDSAMAMTASALPPAQRKAVSAYLQSLSPDNFQDQSDEQ